MTSARAASPIVSNRRSATPVAAAKALPLVLASASPRRAALLAQAGIVPARIVAPEIDETPLKQELPRDYVLRMALLKCQAVAKEDGALILAADTVVAVGRRILPKAANP